MHVTSRLFGKRMGGAVVLSILCLSSWPAQCAQPEDKETIRLLVRRIERLEARVSELEAKQRRAGTTSHEPVSDPGNMDMTETASAPRQQSNSNTEAFGKSQEAPSGHLEPDANQSESVMTDRMDLSNTLLNIRGFGDVSFHGDTGRGDTNTFSLGQLDLFVSSDIADKFRFLSEIVFEGGPDNIYGTVEGSKNAFSVDVERYLLMYSRNEYLNLSVGRGHTAIGYYNTAYHHSTWMQTTVDRPFLFAFEDRGGILPVHYVGLAANGAIRSSKLGLNYIAEFGNGRASRTPLTSEPVQNEMSDTNRKAFNLALFARPPALHGFQAGVSIYRDVLAPASSPRIGESILAAHAVLIRPKFEWLNEALMDRHASFGTSAVFHTTGFYSQISRQWGSYRPYFRYEYLNASNNEPVFSDVALRHGPLFGIRYDATESVALKLQYSYTFLRNQAAVQGLTAQVGFTF
jgi:hypothetical protein